MSKGKARGEQSYRNEELALAMVPEVLSSSGFANVRPGRRGQIKFVDADDATGATLRFWLKLGWTGQQNFSAIQFGLFSGEAGQTLPNDRFEEFVRARIRNVKEAGGSHALFIHMREDGLLCNWVALKIDDVVAAYEEQMRRWPDRARNTKSATLWFEDDRKVAGADCIEAVLSRQIDLCQLAGTPVLGTITVPPATGPLNGPGAKTVTVELERRLRQQAFRIALGNHYGWKCAVSGTGLKEVLDAAHLPGRNWRTDNQPSDGILLRTDLHRLMDAHLARIVDGRFVIEPAARGGEYAAFHNRPIAVSKPGADSVTSIT